MPKPSKFAMVTWSRRRWRHALSVGAALLTGGLFVSYKQLKKLEQRLGIPDPMSNGRKSNYIYFENQENHYFLEDEEDVVKPKNTQWWEKRKDPVLWFPLINSRSHDPHTLLKLSMSEDHTTRLLGVQALAASHQWSDAAYLSVAQAVDRCTLVGLARTERSDPRLFLPQPKLVPSDLSLEDELRRLLGHLPQDSIDKCTQYFTSNALKEGNKSTDDDKGGLWCFGGHGLGFAQSISPVPEAMVEVFCLEALTKHSALASHCPDILKLGGLPCLQRIYESRPNNIKILRSIAQILSNLAVYEQLHAEIIQSGWVTVLHKWIKSADLALSLHATKALANLDSDFGKLAKYMEGVYLYYPQFRYSKPVYADIVFVHGLLGGPFRTWRQKDSQRPIKKEMPTTGAKVLADGKESKNDAKSSNNETDLKDNSSRTLVNKNPKTKEDQYTFCWPKDWLANDCPHVRIITVEYETHLSEWAPKCPYESEKRELRVRSSEMLYKLRRAGIGDRPIIWVGHSMGGLLIKQMLSMAKDDPCFEKMVQNSRGIVFYSVPHLGSPLAAYGTHTKYIMYPSVEVKELQKNSEQLVALDGSFKELMFDAGIPLLSFAEGEKTNLPLNLKMLIVPPESSDPGFGEYHLMSELNHLNICKPENRGSKVYRLTMEFIRDCIPSHLVDNVIKASIPEEVVFSEELES